MPDDWYESESSRVTYENTLRQQTERLEARAALDRKFNAQAYQVSHKELRDPVVSPLPKVEPGESAKRLADLILGDTHARQAQRRADQAEAVDEIFKAVHFTDNKGDKKS
jgi:hypothetical protein